MNNELKLNGMINVLDKEVPNIEGGFGPKKKAMLAKDIADFHNREVRFVNGAINRNKERFNKNVDIIDLKEKDFAVNLVNSDIFSQNSINAANNIYLLSERGYSKLLKVFNDDLSWEIYDKLLDQYFELKDMSKYIDPVLKIIEESSIDKVDKKNMLEVHYLNQLYENRPNSKAYPGMLRTAEMQFDNYRRMLQVASGKEIEEIKNSKVANLDVQKNNVQKKIEKEKNLVSATKIAVDLGLNSPKNNPHRNLIGAIARELGYSMDSASVGYEDKYISCQYGSGNNGVQVLFKPIAVKEIKEWWYKNSESRYSVKKYLKPSKYGDAGDIQTVYYEIHGKKYRVYHAPISEYQDMKLNDVLRNRIAS